MEQDTENYRYELITQPTPEKMDAMTTKAGFLKFQFQHPTGTWRDHSPMRPDERPMTRAVFAQLEI